MSNNSEPLILVVEDNASDEHLLQWAFTKARLRARTYFVRNGAEAVDYILGVPPFDDRVQFPFPELMLVDLRMPRVDGFTLLSWMRKLPALDRLPVAVMSGSTWQQDFEQARALGARFYLNKWQEFPNLVHEIKDLEKALTVPARCEREVNHTPRFGHRAGAQPLQRSL